MGWLVRAWRERDPVFQFLSLFIPLEVCLTGFKPDAELGTCISLIRSRMEGLNPDDEARLNTFLARVSSNLRPSITGRFETMAASAKLPGWESDIKAFKRFNRIRNELIHQGKKAVKLHITVDDNTKFALKDLVERYVSKCLFGDTWIYPDRWRSRPEHK